MISAALPGFGARGHETRRRLRSAGGHETETRTERQSARMSKIKNGGLDQYGAEAFDQQQFGIAGVERVKGQASGPTAGSEE